MFFLSIGLLNLRIKRSKFIKGKIFHRYFQYDKQYIKDVIAAIIMALCDSC